jgi:hypothetical protein
LYQLLLGLFFLQHAPWLVAPLPFFSFAPLPIYESCNKEEAE